MFLSLVHKCSEFYVRRGFVAFSELSVGIRNAIPVFRQHKLCATSEASTIDVGVSLVAPSVRCRIVLVFRSYSQH